MRTARYEKWALQDVWLSLFQKGETRGNDFTGKRGEKKERALSKEMRIVSREILEMGVMVFFPIMRATPLLRWKASGNRERISYEKSGKKY